MDKDTLILEIGRLIVADPEVAPLRWDQFALVAWYGDGVSKLNGFVYVDGGPAKPATPTSFELDERLDELRAATQVEGEARWDVCVFKLDRRTQQAFVEFKYEDAAQWEVTPATASAIAQRIRP